MTVAVACADVSEMAQARGGDTLEGRGWTILMLLLVVFVLAAVVYAMGQVTTLTCERVDRQVNCAAESRLLGLVPLRERTAQGVFGARLGRYCDDDGCRYRVELQSEAGVVPVTSYYSAGTAVKGNMIKAINAFVRDSTAPRCECRNTSTRPLSSCRDC